MTLAVLMGRFPEFWSAQRSELLHHPKSKAEAGGYPTTD
jgi:hypothetical protein